MSSGLFNSAHGAIVFAYNFSDQQGARGFMEKLISKKQNLGSGKGLVGLDGAAQAGMILAMLERIPKEQIDVIRVRYGSNVQECDCCGSRVPCREWRDAVDALSHCVELEGVPREVRYACVTKALGRSKGSAKDTAERFGLSPRTLQRQVSALKKRLTKIESQALHALDELMQATGVIVHED